MKAKVLIPPLTLACLLAMPATAQVVNYAIAGGAAYVARSPNASGNIFIVPTYNGYRVTSIESYAFYDCIGLTSVTILNSVTNIGVGAFFGCTSLTNVTILNGVTSIGNETFSLCTSLRSVSIPDSVTSIGNSAFGGCTSLASVTIGNSVTSIGSGAFDNCRSLTNFSVAAANPAYSSLNGVLFNREQTTLIAFPAGRGGRYVIPNSVTSIGVGAFFLCTSLTNVTIPNSVTNIGIDAFFGCISLTSLTFLGNAPSLSGLLDTVGAGATVYYYYGTTGWGPTYGGLPTVMLFAPQIGPGSARMKPSGFGFTLSGSGVIVIEASTNLATWQPIWTNTLFDTSADFVDPQWLDHPHRFYRARSN